jgi:hypothetical protein
VLFYQLYYYHYTSILTNTIHQKRIFIDIQLSFFDTFIFFYNLRQEQTVIRFSETHLSGADQGLPFEHKWLETYLPLAVPRSHRVRKQGIVIVVPSDNTVVIEAEATSKEIVSGFIEEDV